MGCLPILCCLSHKKCGVVWCTLRSGADLEIQLQKHTDKDVRSDHIHDCQVTVLSCPCRILCRVVHTVKWRSFGNSAPEAQTKM
ncbi:hypothetical protein AVEN_2511-1 [Araneus ventricosus]|uniref:Uncharacterized protein n=1 Tax=Araneus ventricosus TaxID=182803 RepID=A0A4Y2GC44_ARAVE|nr:hypothetical protein AVEN_2511-1 [Araneus ventricosus]